MESSLKVLITVRFAPELVEQIASVSPHFVVTTIEVNITGDVPEDSPRWKMPNVILTQGVPGVQQPGSRPVRGEPGSISIEDSS